MSDKRWLIWSKIENAWLLDQNCGVTRDLVAAYRHTTTEANRMLRAAGRFAIPVLAPEFNGQVGAVPSVSAPESLDDAGLRDRLAETAPISLTDASNFREHGYPAAQWTDKHCVSLMTYWALLRYEYADAMIAVREAGR